MRSADIEKNILEIINTVLKIKKKIDKVNIEIKSITEWDSLANVRIILEIENVFNISILLSEIDEVVTIDNLVKVVKNKIN